MGKANNNSWKWLVPLVILVLGGGGSAFGLYSHLNKLANSLARLDDRQTAARIRNTENIALNAAILAEHGKMISRLDEWARHMELELKMMHGKLDRVLAAVE
jgi:hypothetical protein